MDSRASVLSKHKFTLSKLEQSVGQWEHRSIVATDDSLEPAAWERAGNGSYVCTAGLALQVRAPANNRVKGDVQLLTVAIRLSMTTHAQTQAHTLLKLLNQTVCQQACLAGQCYVG